MANYQTLLSEINRNILTITLNRPDHLNALNTQLFNEFTDLLEKAATDTTIQAVLITGAGKAFCAGADIHRLATLNAENGVGFSHQGQQALQLLETLGKPSLAAINGFAMGGGCELAMAATLRIASAKAVFSQPEVKLGVIPGYGGTQRLPRLIGKTRALDLCITGRTINAETALAYGLVSEVVPLENLLPRAYEILQGILKMAPLAVKSVMEVIQEGADLPLQRALELEASRFGLLCATEDKQEGVDAFLTKRDAHFHGS